MTDSTAELAQRVTELEAENARLRDAAAVPVAAGGRWRTAVSALIIVVAAILVPLSIISAWARVQLIDEEAFVAVLAPIIEDEEVQSLIVDETMMAITENVDFTALTDEVFDGVIELGLPSQAAAALNLLRQPAADGLENILESTVTNVVASDVFSDVWAGTVRGAHRAFSFASTSDGGNVIVITPEGLGVEVGPLIAQVKELLAERGVAAAALIPVIDRTVIIGDADALIALRTTYALADAVGWWLPIVTLVLFAVGIWIARRTSRAIVGTGVAIAIGSGLLGSTLLVGATAVGIAAGSLDLSAGALGAIYGQIIDGIQRSAWVLFAIGILLAIAGWLGGSSRTAGRVRAVIGSINDSIRRWLSGHGVRTGRWGARLARHRVAVRVVVAAVLVAWLFVLPPASIGGLFGVLIIMFVIAWALELLQSRDNGAVAEATPAEAAPAESGD